MYHAQDVLNNTFRMTDLFQEAESSSTRGRSVSFPCLVNRRDTKHRTVTRIAVTPSSSQTHPVSPKMGKITHASPKVMQVHSQKQYFTYENTHLKNMRGV